MKFGSLPCCSWLRSVLLLIMNSSKLCWAALYHIYMPLSYFRKHSFCWTDEWIRLKEGFSLPDWLPLLGRMQKNCLCSYITWPVALADAQLKAVQLRFTFAFLFTASEFLFGNVTVFKMKCGKYLVSLLVQSKFKKICHFKQKCTEFYFLLWLQTMLKQWLDIDFCTQPNTPYQQSSVQ